MKTTRHTSAFIAGLIALAIVAQTGAIALAQSSNPPTAPSSQVPQPDEGGVNWEGVGYGTGSLLTNVVYIPAKLVYAVLGGLVGGGAWCLTGGNSQTANTIWRSSLGGDYVVTPDMLAGKEPIHFSGPTETAPVTPDSTTSVQPITPPPSNASVPANSTMPSSAPASTGGSAPAPMDRGSGSVGHPGTLPDTSIE